MFPPRGRGIGQLGEALALPEPKQLTAATWRLVLALLMCAVLFCVIRARLSDHIPLTRGHQTRPRQWGLPAARWRRVLALLMCAVLFCVIRARLSDHIPLTSGPQTRPRQVVLAAVLVRVCAGLLIVG